MDPLWKAATSSLFLVLCMSVQAQTRVYKSTDAEGHPVFSDTPDATSRTLEIPEANTAEAPVPGERLLPENGPFREAGEMPAAPEDRGRIIVNRDEDTPRETGDGWVTEHTPDGDILVEERRREELEQATGEVHRHQKPVHHERH